MKNWRISREPGVVLIQFEPGTLVDMRLLTKVYDDLSADPQIYSTNNFVWDLRDTEPTLNTGFAEMESMVDYFRARRESWWEHEKTALVVNSKVLFGMARMYASLMEGKLNHRVEIFQDDLTAALEWARLALM